MRAIFAGTPLAAVPSLRALTAVADVAGVITRPDRPRGRSATPQPSPISQEATALGLVVHTPERGDELEATIARFDVDVAVVVAFGMLIRPGSLAVPRAGFVNVHFSLLPRWRGAAPVQRAILAGDDRTGVTLMRMDPGLDTGATLVTRSTGIGATETADRLGARLAQMGGALLAAELARIVAGGVVAVPQDGARATTAPKLTTDERWIGPDADTAAVDRAVRGLTPWPGAWVRHGSDPLRLIDVRPDPRQVPAGEIRLVDGRPHLGTADGSVTLVTVQPAGRRVMAGADWARGLHDGLRS